jgi:hypothetical protein
MLDNKYLVKKGNLTMIPARSQQSNPAVWGENVDIFYHKRFMNQEAGRSLNPIAFRGLKEEQRCARDATLPQVRSCC